MPPRALLVIFAATAVACGGKVADSTITDSTSSSSGASTPSYPGDSYPYPPPPVTDAPAKPAAPRAGPTSCAPLPKANALTPRQTCAKWNATDATVNIAVSEDGRTVSTESGRTNDAVRGTIGKTSGTGYFEVSFVNRSASMTGVGLATKDHLLELGFPGKGACGITGQGISCPLYAAIAPPLVITNVVSVLVDMRQTPPRAWFAIDGVWVGCRPSGGQPYEVRLPEGELYPMVVVSHAGFPLRPDIVRASFAPEELTYAPPPDFDLGWCE